MKHVFPITVDSDLNDTCLHALVVRYLLFIHNCLSSHPPSHLRVPFVNN